MTTAEWQLEQEWQYEKLAAKHPKWAETHKTYLGWLNSGRQVKRGAVAKPYAVTVCTGTDRDIDGELVPRLASRTVKVFGIEQTDPKRGA